MVICVVTIRLRRACRYVWTAFYFSAFIAMSFLLFLEVEQCILLLLFDRMGPKSQSSVKCVDIWEILFIQVPIYDRNFVRNCADRILEHVSIDCVGKNFDRHFDRHYFGKSSDRFFQGWARSRARVRSVVPVILSVVGAYPAALRVSPPAVLSIVSVVANQLASKSVNRLARPEPL